MKCPHCGTENRPEVRFCKNCGRPLNDEFSPPPPAQQPAPKASTSTNRSCPHCGSTVKPEARFCPRCGEALTTSSPPQTSQPQQSYPQSQRQEMQTPAESHYTQPQQRPPSSDQTNLQSSDGAQRSGYVQPQAYPSSSGESSAESSGKAQFSFPTWLWILIGVLGAILLIFIIFMGFQLLSSDKNPSSRVSPTEEVTTPITSTEETGAELPTIAPTPELTATSGSIRVTASPEPETTVPREGESQSEESLYTANLTLNQPPGDIGFGEQLTLTATVTNTGSVLFGITSFELWDKWGSHLELTEAPDISLTSPITVTPQESESVNFVFQAIQSGQTRIRLEATILDPQTLQPIKSIEADPVQITVK